jgi:hypothetical protein
MRGTANQSIKLTGNVLRGEIRIPQGRISRAPFFKAKETIIPQGIVIPYVSLYKETSKWPGASGRLYSHLNKKKIRM